MALVTYERTNSISKSLSHILSDSGYIDVTGSAFLGPIINSIQDALNIEFNSVYEIANNVDIGRASGEYLDRWGRFHNENRESLTYASDLSLNNARIFIAPEVNAEKITVTGEGITIPAGISLSDENETVFFETIDEIYIRPNRSSAYCRIISTTPGAIEAAPGELTKVNINLSDLDNIIPSALINYKLGCDNAFSISGGSELSKDDEYRYIILKKSESIGLFNESKIESKIDIPDIVSLVIKEYRGGANVFVETKNINNTESVVLTLKNVLRQSRSLGLCVNVYAPIIRYFSGKIKLSLKTEDPTNKTQEQFNTSFAAAINAVPMGSNIDINRILNDITSQSDNVENAVILRGSCGDRELVKFNIGQYFNEKMLTSEDRINIS